MSAFQGVEGFQLSSKRSFNMNYMKNVAMTLSNNDPRAITTASSLSRRGITSFVSSLLTFAASTTLAIAAEEVTKAPEKVALGPPPSDFGVTYDYYLDAAKVLQLVV